jgi:N-acetylglucosaminyldiphosphoundecaprenol N-acetyl-beta-D-mannosaminyltransferase
MSQPSAKILGVRLDQATWADIDRFCVEALESIGAHQIVTLNGEIALLATKRADLAAAINQADLVIADSTNMAWAGRRAGLDIPTRTPGSDLVWRLAALAEQHGKGLFLLGGQEGVAEDAAKALQGHFPKLVIHGYSSANPATSESVTAVAEAEADIVLVAYGAPKQEIWIAENKDALGAKLLVGVGGTFDMLSGRLKRAPGWVQSLSLEWLWRFLQQPSRIGRIWRAVVVFPLKVLMS